MNRGPALLAAVGVAAIGLGACKGEAKLTTPTVPKARQAVGSGASPANGAGSITPSTLLRTTGTTARTVAPSDALALPVVGVYKFRDTITPDDDSRGVDRDTHFRLSIDTPRTVRVQATDAAGSPESTAFYEERHDDDGLWLTASALENGVCRWDPKSASLPRRVIDGGTVVTNARCAVGERTLQLETKVSFKVVRNVTIDGRTLRCIDVTRQRVLTDGVSTITSDAVDTYSFELGMRVAASERTTSATEQGETRFTRNLVLVSLPQ